MQDCSDCTEIKAILAMEYEVLWKVVVVIEIGACKKYNRESTNIYCLDF